MDSMYLLGLVRRVLLMKDGYSEKVDASAWQESFAQKADEDAIPLSAGLERLARGPLSSEGKGVNSESCVSASEPRIQK